jgi:alcohol dehydrogenase (cytochrome c)
MTFSHILKRSSSFGFAGIFLLGSVFSGFPAQAATAKTATAANTDWPTFNGDYSGRRYSELSQINRENVHGLKLAWAFQTHAVTLKATPLEVNGVLYFTVPDQVWAVDAKTGAQVWTFRRPSMGDHLGQRGVAFYKDRIYFGTTDAHLICLDAKSGKQIWDIIVARSASGYYLSVAPLVVKGRIILGTSGDDANIPHAIYAFDWKTGALIWKTPTLPKPGTPAARTWPNAKAMEQGGGPAWMTGTYDPELNLIYWGTGNPHPVLAGYARKGDNLYTCTILALDPDTGKLVWYFQSSPHDTHDWDAVETPVLFDANVQGKPRKLLAQASRNGYFFVLDRTNGKNLVSEPFIPTNFANGVRPDGSPNPDPAKEPQFDGALVSSPQIGGTNWGAPSFDPETGLFYVNSMQGYSFWYLRKPQKGVVMDHSGGDTATTTTSSALLAIDYKTGKIRWQREGGKGNINAGVLTTAGHVLFTSDISGNLLALDPETGKVLWHTRPGGNQDNAQPITYQLDGTQYVVTGVDSVVYAWTLTGSL